MPSGLNFSSATISSSISYLLVNSKLVKFYVAIFVSHYHLISGIELAQVLGFFFLLVYKLPNFSSNQIFIPPIDDLPFSSKSTFLTGYFGKNVAYSTPAFNFYCAKVKLKIFNTSC
jgi:hypothetical protein